MEARQRSPTLATSSSYTLGVLTIKDNQGHTAQLHFSGTYTFGSFNLNNDGHGGTVLTDPPVAPLANVALFGNYIAAGFPEPAATPCPALLAGHEALAQLLAIPAHGS
jgi:hypothetical protein